MVFKTMKVQFEHILFPYILYLIVLNYYLYLPLQLINKFDELLFTKNDENFVEAFAIFCGMGIHNTHMYEKAITAMAKQSVTLDVSTIILFRIICNSNMTITKIDFSIFFIILNMKNLGINALYSSSNLSFSLPYLVALIFWPMVWTRKIIYPNCFS